MLSQTRDTLAESTTSQAYLIFTQQILITPIQDLLKSNHQPRSRVSYLFYFLDAQEQNRWVLSERRTRWLGAASRNRLLCAPPMPVCALPSLNHLLIPREQTHHLSYRYNQMILLLQCKHPKSKSPGIQSPHNTHFCSASHSGGQSM